MVSIQRANPLLPTHAGSTGLSLAILDSRGEKESQQFAAELAERLSSRYGIMIPAPMLRMQRMTSESAVTNWLASVSRTPPSAIVAIGTHAAVRCRERPVGTPLLFGVQEDPRLLGLAASLISPDRDATGVWNTAEVHCKRLELLRKLAPRARRIGLVLDRHGSRRDSAELHLAGCIAPSNVQVFAVDSKDEVHKLGQALARTCDAVLVPHSDVVSRWKTALLDTIGASKLPAVFDNDQLTDQGALASVEPIELSLVDVFSRMIYLVVHGVPISSIPIEQPRTTRSSLNLVVARQLGIKVPFAVIKSVDRVVERR